jgi:hypothetical protein
LSALTKQAARIDAFVVPVVTFASATVFFALAAASVHYSPFRASTWSRWDSGHYVAIARSAYNLADAGWMPAYPALIRLVHSFGLPFGIAAIVVADALALATLLLVWNGFLDRGKSAGSVGCMLLATFFPGAAYHHVMFPISMVTFFVLLTIWLLGSRRRGRVFDGLRCRSRDCRGSALALHRPPDVRAVKAAVGSGLVLCGLGATLLMQKVPIGRWDGLFYVQRKYGHGLHNPVTRRGPCLLAHTADLERGTSWRALGVSPYRGEALLVPLVLIARRLPAPVLFTTAIGFIVLAFVMGQLFFNVALV